MKKVAVMTLSALLIAGSAGAVMAGGKDCKGHGSEGDRQEMSEHRIDRLAQHLSLNEEQKGAIEKIFEDKYEKRKASMESRESFRKKMDSLDPESANYVTQVEKLATEQSSSMVQKMVDRAETKAEIYAVLTDEQEEKFEELKEHREKKGGFGDKRHDDDYRH